MSVGEIPVDVAEAYARAVRGAHVLATLMAPPRRCRCWACGQLFEPLTLPCFLEVAELLGDVPRADDPRPAFLPLTPREVALPAPRIITEPLP